MISIKVPPLGESIVEATVSRWLKKEGDVVQSGETLVELETDKITVEVPAFKAGTLGAIKQAEGAVVKVDDVLAELDESKTGPAAAAASGKGGAGDKPADSKETAPAPAPAPATAPAAAPPPAPAAKAASATPAKGAAADVRASPAAQRLATAQGVDLGGVSGTGRGGVVSKPDVMDHMASGDSAAMAPSAGATKPEAAPAAQAAAPSPAPVTAPRDGQRETREKMTTRRRRIAENLLQAQHQTAHLTTFNEIDMTAVSALRERFKERTEKDHGVKLSFMPFFVKAAVMALQSHPVVNAQIDGDSVVYRHYVNMGIAVASEAGLVVPNVKDADKKGLLDISRDIAAVAKRARDGKLTMDDLTGGTFTITNGGVFGSLLSTPIINFPQVAILGLHKTQDRPVAIEGRVEVRSMMYVALTYDHRIIDGQQAVLFLVRIKELMEDPAAMLIA